MKTVKYIEYIFLSIIIAASLISRLYKINNPIADWHSWRQADTASVTRTFVSGGINLLYPKYHDISSIQTGIFNPKGYRFVEFPIYNAIHALLAKTRFPFTLEVWGRLVSVFSSLVTIFFVYLIGKKLLGVNGGLLTAFFFGLLPYNIYFSRVILPEPLALAFGVFAIWAFMKFVEAKNYLFLYISSLSFALGALTKPFVLFYMIPAAYLAVKTFGFKGILNSRKLLFNLLAAFDLAVIPFFLWRIWMNQFPQGIPFFTWAFNGDGIRFRPAFWKWIFVERIGHLILGSWGIVLLFFGFFKGKQKELFSLVFFLAMFLYISVFATANVRHDYYQAAIIPAVSLILARGFIYVWELARKNTLSIFVFLFALAMMFLGGLSMVKEFYNINHPEIILAGQEVDKLAPKDGLV